MKDESFSFWKSLILVLIFLIVTPITIGVSIFSILSLTNNTTIEKNSEKLGGVKIYASLPKIFPEVSDIIHSADARPVIIKNYLIRYDSPLLGQEEYIIKRSDELGIDFRLITAIAQQESNLCKIIPVDSYNCWGWGIHSKGTLRFNSYQEAIDAVTLGLKKEYIDKGLTTPDTIWKKYTPSSPDGAWAKGVNQFIAEIK